MYIAKRGTSGIAVSIERLGSTQPPERNSWVQGPSPVVVGLPNAAFSQKPKASASIGKTTSPSAVTASLIGALGSRPKPRSSELTSGCSEPRDVLANGTWV